MTKREYLESIGYECECFDDGEEIPEVLWKYYEGFNGAHEFMMYINLARSKYFVEFVTFLNIENQRQIDDLQIAFNNVKRDFEEMQKYED